MSLYRTDAALMPDVALTVNRCPQRLSRSNHHSPVSTSTYAFDTSSAVHFRSSFRYAPDAVMPRLFRNRSPPWLLTTAAFRRFVAWSCNPTTRGQLSSHTQLLLAHGDRRALFLEGEELRGA